MAATARSPRDWLQAADQILKILSLSGQIVKHLPQHLLAFGLGTEIAPE